MRLSLSVVPETREACRLCLSTGSRMLPIFRNDAVSDRLRSQILDCCPIELFEHDALPKVICGECESKVAAAYEFRERCRVSERKLRQCYEPKYSTARSTGISSTCKTFRDTHVQTEFVDGPSAIGNRPNGPAAVDDGGAVFSESPGHCHERETVKEEGQRARGARRRHIVSNRQGDEHLPKLGHTDREVASDPIIACTSNNETTIVNEDPDDEPVSARSAEDGSKEGNLSTAVGRRIGGESPAVSGKGRQYLCDVCSKTFLSKSGLRFHLKAHDGSKPHLCRHCGKGFAIPSYARRHEKIHETDKRFVCHVCSAAFASSNGFKYHLRSHTGEANYRCETCGKSFGRLKYLKEHVFTHTGERPFVCKICGSSYGNSGSLFVHEKKCKARQSFRGEKYTNNQRQR